MRAFIYDVESDDTWRIVEGGPFEVDFDMFEDADELERVIIALGESGFHWVGGGAAPVQLIVRVMMLPSTRDPEQLAAVFAATLRSSLSLGEWVEMCRRNRAETRPDVCHSHDFCDANDMMMAAWEQLGYGHRLDEDDEPAFDTWNAAWAIAAERHLRTAVVA